MSATPYNENQIHFTVPERFVGKTVRVKWAMPMITMSKLGVPNAQFSVDEGTLLDLLQGSIVIGGPGGEVCIPMNRIWDVTCPTPKPSAILS